jgi:hypothetical protein
LTIVAGQHPSGITYRTEGNHPLVLEYKKIVWPAGWTSTCIKTAYDLLVKKFGPPFTPTKGDRVTVNEPWFVGKFAAEHLILHDPGLGFFEYDAPSGLWRPRTEAAIGEQFSRDIKDAADQFGEASILNSRNARFFNSLVSQLRGHVEKIDAFASSQRYVVHTIDGMLDLGGESPTLLPFDPSYHSLHQFPWHYDEQAT